MQNFGFHKTIPKLVITASKTEIHGIPFYLIIATKNNVKKLGYCACVSL